MEPSLTNLQYSLTAANCFNGTNLRVRVIDRKDGPEKAGRADGLKSISLEILDTFGIGDTILKDSQRCEEIVLWNPDKNGVIKRTMTIADKVEELMKPREVTLDQGTAIHRCFFCDYCLT